jgi:N-acetylglucosaminyldiphosphoundecaprenol N-acetyl-beta-D-mannosaminyltransferase
MTFARKLEISTIILSRISAQSLEELCSQIATNYTDESTFIWTVNLSHLREYSEGEVFFQFLNGRSILTADGWPIKYLVKIIDGRKVSRIPGVEIAKKILQEGRGFAVIGAKQQQVVSSIEKHSAGNLDLMKFHYDEKIDVKSIAQLCKIGAELNRHAPKITFIALGFPKQELLFDALLKNGLATPGVCIGVGGSFQMLSGEKIRAPRLVQHLGLEWTWRLVQDPIRLAGRYFKDFKFFLIILFYLIFKGA